MTNISAILNSKFIISINHLITKLAQYLLVFNKLIKQDKFFEFRIAVADHLIDTNILSELQKQW